MFDINDNKTTAKQVILPVAIVSFTFTLFLAYQTMQVIGDRVSLTSAKTQQSVLFENSQKLQNQLTGLISGTQKLANDGNKNAEDIVVKLKAMGVLGDEKAKDGAAAPTNPIADAPAQVPASTEKATRGPIKP